MFLEKGLLIGKSPAGEILYQSGFGPRTQVFAVQPLNITLPIGEGSPIVFPYDAIAIS